MADNDNAGDVQDVSNAQAEDGQQPKKSPKDIAGYWLSQVQSAEKRRKPFITRGKQILKRYRNKRTLTTLGVPMQTRRMNVLWSNVETQQPVLYSQTPKANVSRRNKTKDAIGRTASIVLQNCLQNSLGMEDFDYVMEQVVLDRLLPGSGVAMIEYVPQVENDQVGWQAAETRYVNWMDWGTNQARTWQEVDFFYYNVYLTKQQAYNVALASGGEKFAQDVWDNITLDHRNDKGNPDKDGNDWSGGDGPAKATVHVIWDKTGKQVLQVAPGYQAAPLAVLPPPVNFDGFFPCPRPLQSSTTNDTFIPIPDFEQYVDQADEVDLMTQRISILAQALKLRGLYPADMDSLKQLTEGGDMDMIPYDQWQLIAERGGAEALVIWFPVEAIAKTMIECINARDKALDIMYQVTGISDIRRGDTDANETAKAQQLKAQFGSIRTRKDQRGVQRFIRDLLRLKAEVICEHFTLDTIKVMSGVKLLTEQEKVMVQQAAAMWRQFGQAMQQFQQMLQQNPGAAPQLPGQIMNAGGGPVLSPPPQPTVPQPSEEMMEALEEPSWEQIMAILSNEKLRGFVVDVETDSTVEPDQQAQQQAAVEFTAAVAQFMTATLPVVQYEPESVELFGELMAWVTRQWKAADTIEEAIDEFVDKMKKKIEQAQQNPPPPDPKMQTEQVKAQAAIGTAQIGQQTAVIKGQAEQAKAKTELVGTILEHQTTMKEKEADAAIAKEAAKAEPSEAADA